MVDRLVHHLVYTSLSSTTPVACEATAELAEARARKYLNGHAVLFISGQRTIWKGEVDNSESYYKTFECPVCARVAFLQAARDLCDLFAGHV